MADNIVSERVAVPGSGDSPLGMYLAAPSAPGRYPAVIVGMELFGVTHHIRNVADRLAADGFVAAALDFYHRSEPGVELSYDQEGRSQGFSLLHRLSRKHAVDDVRSAMAFLRQRPECLPRVGFLGFSVGGHIGYLAATQLDLAASSIFYAGWLTNTEIELSQPEPTITLTRGIRQHDGCLIYFVGADDFLVTADQRDEIAGALQQAGVRHEMVVYPDAGHGFFCDERESFIPRASNDAWERTIAMLSAELR